MNFLRDYHSFQGVQQEDSATGRTASKPLSDLLVEQVEFADVILISKTDTMTNSACAELAAVLRKLNGDAEIIPMALGQIPLDKILDTGRFSLEKAARAPVWLKELRGEHVPEMEAHGIASTVYRSNIPFHPVRLHAFLSKEWTNGRLLRCKGYFWLASRYVDIGILSQAGGPIRHSYIGRWWRFIPPDQWPRDEYRRARILERWTEESGDCRQEIVFIGQTIDFASLHRELDDCLLTMDEIELGVDSWTALPDPLGV
jgi:G3E family GTPase